MMQDYGTAGTTTSSNYGGTPTWPTVVYIRPRVLIFDHHADPYRDMARMFDEFRLALMRCHDALADLLRPMLRALRRPTASNPGQSILDRVILLICHRPRPREVVHRRGVFNFHKVKA